MFLKTFESGELPSAWKKAHITPLHKSGSKLFTNNYRPVSLTSIPCKLFETILTEEMLKFLLSNLLLSEVQHVFLPHKARVTNILETLDIITDALAKG